jgi:hypothetical protein
MTACFFSVAGESVTGQLVASVAGKLVVSELEDSLLLPSCRMAYCFRVAGQLVASALQDNLLLPSCRRAIDSVA